MASIGQNATEPSIALREYFLVEPFACSLHLIVKNTLILLIIGRSCNGMIIAKVWVRKLKRKNTLHAYMIQPEK